MKGKALLLTSLLAVAACGPAADDVAVAEAPAVAPVEIPDGGPRAPEPPEVFPVPVGTACGIRGGWSDDKDPAGLNVRAAPSANAAILGRLPTARYEAEFERDMRSGFAIVEVRDGWVRIREAYDPAGKALDLPEGWISARHVGFDLQTDKAFAEPDPTSAVVAKTRFTNGVERRFAWRDLAGCRGAWVRMTFTGADGVEKSGWARGVCNSQETSCDGAKGDSLTAEEAR